MEIISYSLLLFVLRCSSLQLFVECTCTLPSKHNKHGKAKKRGKKAKKEIKQPEYPNNEWLHNSVEDIHGILID